jgi:hypothetical protein
VNAWSPPMTSMDLPHGDELRAQNFQAPRGAIEDKVNITNADCRFMRTRMALGSELEGPRLGHENIATRRLGHAPKAREVQMHPADQ